MSSEGEFTSSSTSSITVLLAGVAFFVSVLEAAFFAGAFLGTAVFFGAAGFAAAAFFRAAWVAVLDVRSASEISDAFLFVAVAFVVAFAGALGSAAAVDFFAGALVVSVDAAGDLADAFVLDAGFAAAAAAAFLRVMVMSLCGCNGDVEGAQEIMN
jgi:hypothetical protein